MKNHTPSLNIMFDSSTSLLFPVDVSLRRWIRDIRRHIHMYPELSFRERETAAFIEEKLRELGLAGKMGIAGTGVTADLGGGATAKQGVMLRADMDALPVTEETGLPFSSKNSGIMHACGHDGHVAMLLGAAALLAKRDLPGPVRLLFQPAEENGNGAQHCVAAGVLDGMGAVFAGHIDTHYPLGAMTIDEGVICAWADPFTVRLTGRSGHAARPHESVDTVVAAANLILAVQTIISRGVDPNRAAVITIGTVQAGTAQNIIAGEAVLSGTIRSTHGDTRRMVLEGMERVVEAVGAMHGVQTALTFDGGTPAVENDRESSRTARLAAGRTPGVGAAISQGASSLGGEDFSFFQQKIPGCLVRFGASLGDRVGVAHNGQFDFDEEVLAIGASWYANVAWQWLCDRYGEAA